MQHIHMYVEYSTHSHSHSHSVDEKYFDELSALFLVSSQSKLGF